MENTKSRVLVVDDEPEIVGTLKNFLFRKGYRVDIALNGEEALNILEKEGINLILLDLKMPGLSGEEIAKIIREKYPTVKIIVVTAYPQKSHNLCRQDMLEDVLIKPVTPAELYEKILEVGEKKTDIAVGPDVKRSSLARLFLIKAKILFLEPAQEYFKFLEMHLKNLSHKGEDYRLEKAGDLQECREKISILKPDILAVNASCSRLYRTDIYKEFLRNDSGLKEIIIYNQEAAVNLTGAELGKLVKSIEAACLKHGLIEVKWAEI